MRYYLESDGKVFTIEKDGLLDLPRRDEIPFEFDEIAPLATSEPVMFCVPSTRGSGKERMNWHHMDTPRLSCKKRFTPPCTG